MPLIDILIPEEIGPVEECVIVTWLKREGDQIKEGDDLLVIQTDKTAIDVPSPVTGILSAILVQQGDIAKPDQPLARMEVGQADGATDSEPATTPETVSASVPPTDRQVRASPVAKRLARQHSIDLTRVKGSGKNGRITEKDILAVVASTASTTSVSASSTVTVTRRDILASPVARRMAQDQGIDLADIPGAGARRLTEKDVRAYLETPQSPTEAASLSENADAIPMAGMRAMIAQRMHQSLQEMAQLTLHTEADVTDLIALRADLKSQMPVTYTDLMVRAAALALKQHPRLNATLRDKAIQLQPHINIGLAVAVEDGLMVPVLRGVDQQPLTVVVRERKRLVERARTNKLLPNEYSEGTFTITNLGTYDIDAFTPIVNPPEAAILGVGRITEKVVIHKNKIAQRSMMTLSLSFDHRINDGAPAAAFLRTVKRNLEQPDKTSYLQ